VAAPDASAVSVVVFDDDFRPAPPRPLQREADDWVGVVDDGAVYGLVADGDGPRFDPAKVLVDPRALEVLFPPGHDRRLASARGAPNAGRGPLAVARRPPAPQPRRRSSRSPVVCEAHVGGLTRLAGGAHPGTYAAVAAQLPRLSALGVSVLELMPVHQADPAEGSYWGYMPLNFAAVEHRYAAGGDAAGELAALVTAAHEHDIEVWLDVVFNHTTEIDETGPTYNLRGLSDRSYYRLAKDGLYLETSGCGNDLDITSPAARGLVQWSLDRLADLGVDGFRFDLAAVLARDAGFLGRLDRWAAERGLRMIAEPWDAAGTYLVGRAWTGSGWLQWNDRFRDDVRGFLRGDEGLVPRLQLRMQGSPDLFDAPLQSVNFVACHDGFTLYDVVAYDHKHNEANGEGGRDGTNDNRSWNCGWEGDDGVPDEVVALRRRQLRNAWCLLALAHGVPMFVMGDEFGRTQGGNNNAYNQDNETSWVDWERAAEFADLEQFVGKLLALRDRHPVLSQPDWWGEDVQWFGTAGPPDLGPHSRSLAWSVGGLYVMVNAWWEPLEFRVLAPGPWSRVVDTMDPDDDVVEVGFGYTVGPRSVVVLERVGASEGFRTGRGAGNPRVT
jgi:glycogen operon protein